jgi:hypothetical protein
MHRAAGHESSTAHGVVRATLAGICRERGVAPRPKTALLVGELRSALATAATAASTCAIGRCCSLGSPGRCGAASSSGSTSATSASRAKGRCCVCAARRPTKRERSRKSPCCTARIRTPARSARSTDVAGNEWAGQRAAVSGRRPRGVHRRRPLDGPHRGRAAEEDRRTQWPRAAKLRGHSLRSGFATSAARANKSEAAIMRQGRCKSIPVARRYIRAGSRWHHHAGAGIGL